MTYITFNTPLGTLTVYEADDAIYKVELGDTSPKEAAAGEPSALLQEAKNQLLQYMDGKRQTFDVPLSLNGTPFQNSVWQALQQIPYGETRSYKDIAEQVGSSQGYRAVGMANSQNPLPIFVPCHRVIQADGSIGGYALGPHRKQQLLLLEEKNK